MTAGNPSCQLRIVGWLLGALTLLIAAAIWWGVANEESDLMSRAQAALATAGIALTIEFEGRDGTLSGSVENPADIDRAEDIVFELRGVRTLGIDTIRLASPAPEVINLGGAGLQLDFDGTNLTLSGQVPDEAAASDLISAAASHYGAGHVIGLLSVDATTDSPQWLDSFSSVFTTLDGWDSGTMTVSDDGIVLTGVTDTVSTSEGLASRIGEATGLSVDNRIAPTQLNQPMLVVAAQDGSIFLSGELSSEADIALVIHRAQSLYDNVETSLSVGPVHDAEWIPLIPGFFEAVAGWSEWQAEISSQIQRFTGLAPSTDALVDLRSTYLAQFGSNWDDTGLEVAPEALADEITAALTGTINFGTASSVLDDASEAALDEIVVVLAANPSATLIVEGHTDSDGDNGVNLALSQDRAQSVVDYLVGKGIDAGRLAASGFGDTRPIADNGTPEGRAENRRIEFVVQGDDGL